MPTIQLENLPKNSAKLTITVPQDELVSFLEDAASHISEHAKIPGFRPGKAGYDIVKHHVGEMKIYEEALEKVVRKTFVEAVLDQKLETVGSPAIDVVKLAPGNDLIYSATVTLMPKIEQMADFRTISVSSKSVEVSEEDVEKMLKDIQRMQTKEIRMPGDHAALKENKIVVDMDMKKNGVPLEGGQALNHSIYLNEDYYIPGLSEQLIGMKEGEEKSFDLSFPKEHYQENLAGQNIRFEMKAKEIYSLENPTLDDAFAQIVGQKDLEGLKNILRENIRREKAREEDMRVEREMLDAIATGSRFGDIPDLLINEEINRMIEELKRNADEQGMTFETYLQAIKKTIPELKVEISPQAVLRVKVGLIIREIAKKENVSVSDEEIDKELDELASHHKDKETRDHIYSPMYREYMENALRNRKVLALLKETMIKSVEK
jgi:trigger factor